MMKKSRGQRQDEQGSAQLNAWDGTAKDSEAWRSEEV